MNKYLKTENASITVEYSTDILVTLFKNSMVCNRGFQRLFIECKASNLVDVYKELKKLIFNDITVFIKISDYNDKYSNIMNEVNKDFYTIIYCDVKTFLKIKNNKDCFYELNFKYTEKDKIIDIVNKYDNILLHIDYNLSKLTNINVALDKIVAGVKSKELNFSNLFMEKELIYDCPYNIYLNNENSNRSYGNNIPRNIFIDSFGFVYCMSIKNKKIVIGNINNNTISYILDNCKSQDGYKKFIYYNERLFINLLNQCPYSIIDYTAFLIEVMKNYE